MSTFFIADLHLHPERPATVRAFYYFLEHIAQEAQALYLLGDIFEVWLGDDDDTALYQDIINALTGVTQKGTRVFFMHGNRDFLIGSDFCRRTGATLLPDPTQVVINHRALLLMHGDTLCTRDQDYMAFRQQVRSKAWQQHFLSQPLAERRAYASQVRAQSQNQNNLKASDIMDVTPSEVVRAMTDAGINTLIHGHTHRPHRHSVDLGATKVGERIVLGDWDESGWYIVITDNSLSLKKFTPPSHY